MRPHRNRGLFSNYYLDELLPKEEEFKAPISEVEGVFEKVKGIWDKSRFEAINEDQLRKHFLDKVLDYLGWVVDVNAPVPTGEWSKRPDYAFFLNNESLKTAQKGKKDDYFKKVTCIAEAKRLGRPLDKRLKTESDPFEVQIPSMQISKYLWLTGVRWGILTDGKYWRLYERETSKRLDIFYEVDLEDLIESDSPESFRYFYLLFRKEAFAEFIEKVYTGSVDYAEEVGKELKENIYQALETLAQGFLKTSGNNLTEAHLKEIHDNSLILLYRLLFILYAEHRDLLPLGVNKLYTESYSLDAFKKEIANRFDKNEPIATSTIGYWNKLKELFEIINGGNKELGVPPYNGGLFDPEKHHFLEKYRIGDLYVAKAIDLLSRSKDKAYIDYGSLEIRHLGSIYEGLLEYKLKIADQDLVPIKDKGKEIFVSLAEAKKQKNKVREDEKIQTGEIYLVTDKGERKATGSYYTPDYIVKYIVENTLGPLVEEKRKKVSENIEELKEKIKGARGASREFHEKVLRKAEGSLIDEILSLKVLDPAMGSGHFLVEATDFLARELLRILSGEPLAEHSKEMVVRESLEPYGLKEPEEEDIRWARREVVERCIFGVDLNPMAVELAKLSLWLYTVAKNRPLNFLDHHLRVGNSLIGAGIDDLASLPEFKKKKAKGGPVQLGLFESIFKEKVNILLGAFAQIEMLPSDTVEQIREKEELYQNFRKIVSRFQDVADVWISIYFANDVDFANYQKLQSKLRSTDEEWERLSQEEWFKRAKEIVKEKRFFHWELEFPEIFFAGHQRKENPGFDAVVGNPPYVKANEISGYLLFDRRILTQLKQYRWLVKKWDLYIAFIERAVYLTQRLGVASLIVPDVLDREEYAATLRDSVVQELTIIQLDYFPDVELFKDVGIRNMIFFFQKREPEDSWSPIRRLHVDETTRNYVEVSRYTQKAAGGRIFRLDYVPSKHPAFMNYLPIQLLFYLSVGMVLNADEKIAKGAFDKEDLLSKKKDSVHSKSFADNQSISRYLITISQYLEWNTDRVPKKIRRPTFPELHKGPRLLFTRSGESTITNDDIVCDQRVMILKPWYSLTTVVSKSVAAELQDIQSKHGLAIQNLSNLSKSYDLRYVLTLLNCIGIVTHFLQQEKRDRYDLTPDTVRKLPIRRVDFITIKAERERLFTEGRKQLEKHLEIGKADTILHFIESRLMKEHKPDKELVKKHNADPLNKNWQIPEGALWEQSDVVHDILAFLAEQMIDMNKEKQKEIKGYLKWLESQLKIHADKEGNTGIEALTGKTQIKNYLGDYEKGEEHLPFEEFLKILEKNKNRVQANLKSRELYENIRSEYEKSLSKLLPLKEKLRKTDWLIDQIVYRLYGLTEEEVEIVERSYS